MLLRASCGVVLQLNASSQAFACVVGDLLAADSVGEAVRVFRVQGGDTGALLDVRELLQLLLLRAVLQFAEGVQESLCQHAQELPRPHAHFLICIKYIRYY
jgi:hypothetical protein